MKLSLTNQIFIAIVGGILFGVLAPEAVPYISWVGEVFVLALKMLLAPLLLASIVMGMAALGDVRELGSLGGKTLAYYASTTVIAVIIGLVVVNVVRPGVSDELSEADSALVTELAAQVKARSIAADDHAATTKAIGDVLGTAARTRPADALPEAAIQRVKAAYAARAQADGVTGAEGSAALLGKLLSAERFRLRIEATQSKDASAAGEGKLKSAAATDMTVSKFLRAQLSKIFQNPFASLATMNVLGIIIFALLLGGVLTTLGERGATLLGVFDGLNQAMMKLIDVVMLIAPSGVFALMAGQIAASGVGILLVLLTYMLTVLGALFIHGVIVLPLACRFLAGVSPWAFLGRMRQALAVAFSTSSSSATLPVTMDCLEEQAGVPPRISGFVIPLGATVNMDGTALYEAVAALFIAQVYGIDLSIAQQILIALTATLAAVGAAGIPSAGTVTMVMVLSAVGLPLEGIGLILAVDRLLDMCRTTVNVWGDSVGAAVIARLEGQPASMPDLTPGGPAEAPASAG